MSLLDLFAGTTTTARGGRPANSNAGRPGSVTSRSSGGSRRRRDMSEDVPGIHATCEEDRKLFTNCVSQVQRNLKAHLNSPRTLHTLASYYTKTDPYIEDRPFCVSLSCATFLFHIQMARISVMDVDIYVQLISQVMAQIPDDEKLTHPFIQQVLRDHVFGLPSPTCRGGAHCVVLVPPPQYRAFATLTTSLLALGVVPLDIVYQFQDQLESYCSSASPIVANRALALFVHNLPEVRIDEQITALQYVLQTKPQKINVDFLMACYERLQRASPDPANGPAFGRAIAIHCSELFLRFRSPVRREYVERYLYPSLCHPDMADFLAIPATRQHLLKELLSLCTPDMGTANPYYLCICALMQKAFDHEIDGALEVVTLISCQMPHAAYVTAVLAVDSHMSVSLFAKVVIALARGAGLAMTGREVPDEVAASINKRRTSVYNVLFLLREVVRNCSMTSSRRASEMLKALRVAVAIPTIEALGKLSSEAFEGQCDIMVDPQLLCAELAMVLHGQHIEEAMDSSVAYFKDVTSQCTFCGMQRSEALLCPVNGTVHVCGHSSVSRVLSSLAECAGSKALEEKLVKYLHDPAMQMESSVHFLLYHILANAGQYRTTLFLSLEPYIRNTLLTLVNVDRGTARGLVSSELKANVLMLHVKVAMLLTTSIDPSYLESILRVFSEMKLRNNHDALALWFMGNLLLRNCKGNIDILPTDPHENNYCVDFPGCAPTSSTCADNAQLVLKLLDRAHTFSPETRKLVGCCVCKLIQDFNMQTPNIVSALLSSHGFIPVGLVSLSELALPVGQGSTFWSFFLQQMKTSAPARTSFMVTLAKSMARRFRITNPADAVSVAGLEATGHPYTVMMYEAMKRSPALTRVVLFMVSNWMKQPGHTPGKFVCLVYITVQLINVILGRGDGGSCVELEAETGQDRFQFKESVQRAAKLLKAQQGRLEKLMPAARRNSPEFAQLVHKLQCSAVRCVARTNGEHPPEEVDYEEGEMTTFPVYQTPANTTVTALQELHQAADDSVFDANDYMEVDDDGGHHFVESVDLGSAHNTLISKSHNASTDPFTVGSTLVSNIASSSSPLEQPPSILKSGTRRNPAAPPTYSVVTDAEVRRVDDHLTRSCAREVQADDESGSIAVLQRPKPVSTPAQRTRSHDKSTTAPHDRSIGTSPVFLDKPTHTVDMHTPPIEGKHQPGRVTSGRGSAWQEPDLIAYIQGDETPIEERQVPQLQASAAQESGVVLPSGLVLEYLRTHQALDSLRHELNQLEQGDPQMMTTANRDAIRYAEQGAVAVQHATMEVTVEGRVNNYCRPHDSTQLAAGRTVRLPVHMISTIAHQTSYSTAPYQQGAVSASHNIVDGEDPIDPVSDADTHSKRRRTEEGQDQDRQAVSNTSATAAEPNLRGRNFFLHQNQAEHLHSALQDIRHMQKQQNGIDKLIQQQQQSRVPGNEENYSPTRRNPLVDPQGTALSPATPYGQVVLPTCFVEQRNDTAIRELRQVMGAHNPNDKRLSRGGKTCNAGGSSGKLSEGEVNNTSSSAWWTEMSSAPMPTYAADPQYSMELF